MATLDITKLSYGELQKLLASTKEALAEKRDEELKILADGYAKKCAAAGFSPEEAIEALKPYLPSKRGSAKKAAAGVAFRDPANPSNTWGGRGKRPAWLNAYLEQGRSKEEFAV